MTFSADVLVALMSSYLWPFFRIAALVGSAPIFGTRIVPMSFKVGMSVLLTMVIVPVLPPVPTIDPFSVDGVLVTIYQVLIGLSIGFSMRLVFSAIETGGHVIGQTMGLGFAQMLDPANGITVPVMSQFFTVFATLIFLAINGHLMLINVLAESFTVLPIALSGVSADGYWDIINWGSWIFTGAVMISLPVIAALLVVNVAFGVMMRAAPQLNVFSIGFPLTLMLGFIFIFAALPIFSTQFTFLMDTAFDFISRMLGQP